MSNAHLIAGVAATLIAWRTKSLTLTILVGMGVFPGLRRWWVRYNPSVRAAAPNSELYRPSQLIR